MAGPPVGTDIAVELPEGDPVNGEALANSQGCVGCHVSTATGPAWPPSAGVPGIGERAETRFRQPDYTGNANNAEQYLLESIVQTNVYIVEGYAENLMPGNYSSTLTAQDAADLIAYLLTVR
jgi:mono/diheme cytochrome c family protein